MRTEKIEESPVPKVVPAKENAMIPIIEEFEASGDQYHQVVGDFGVDEYERYAQQMRSATKTIGVDEYIKVHNTYQYDEEGKRRGRILWLENMKAN